MKVRYPSGIYVGIQRGKENRGNYNKNRSSLSLCFNPQGKNVSSINIVNLPKGKKYRRSSALENILESDVSLDVPDKPIQEKSLITFNELFEALPTLISANGLDDIYSLWVIQSWNYRLFILVITVSSSGYFSGVGGIC